MLLNMRQAINITPEDIKYAESILLGEGIIFDEEQRKSFIRDLRTIDLQAVPGSGKTTVLLAKLLILERKLPFNDGSGILVISHTNAAVDEIKYKIQKYCPRLFSYPNFIGTIQSFVDDFLAIPFCLNYLGVKINFIDQDRFRDEIIYKFNNIKWLQEYGKPQGLFFAKYIQRAIIESINFNNCSLIKKDIEKELKKHNKARTKPADLLIELNKFSKTGSPIITKIKLDSKLEQLTNNDLQYIMLDYEKEIICDYNEDLIVSRINSKKAINEKYKGFKVVIESVLNKGILSYRYAYLLGKNYLHFYPKCIEILQKRFSFIFVDEMQDMDKYQYDLLEKIFFDEGRSSSIYQRIGDKNQSIYNGNAKDEDYWRYRETILPLSGSHRLTPEIAKVVNNFALLHPSGFEIVGLKAGTLKPHLIRYTNESIQKVIPKYLEIVKQLQANGTFPLQPKNPIKIVAWNSLWSTIEQKENPDNVRLVDYYNSFSRSEHKLKTDFSSLKAYLLYFDKSKKTLESIRKNILNALLKILSLENILNADGKHFTKKQLIESIKEKSEILKNETYETLKLNLYNWSIGIIKGKLDLVYESVCGYIPEFLEMFQFKVTFSQEFMIAKLEDFVQPESQTNLLNKFKIGELEVEVTTIHAVKGQTHSATLYLESSYQGLHESERLFKQFLGQPFDNDKTYHKQSTKMAYVGLSRPTNLLCIAVHEDRFNKYFNKINTQEWQIEEA